MGNDETVWKYFNEELGIHTIEEAIKYFNNFSLNIGTLGCRFTQEAIIANREQYRREVLGEVW